MSTEQAPTPAVTHSEILNVEDLATWLKVSKRSIYEMTRERGQQRHEIPLPILRLPVDVTGKICTRWNERESTWRKSGSCQSRGTNQSKS
jgi:hypothetical protein